MPQAVTPSERVPSAMHLPSLIAALAIMLARGVGFVPRALAWRLLFSGWSCTAALLLAAGLWWLV